MADAYIGFGSNLGDRFAHLGRARDALTAGGERIVTISSIYDTPPWGPVAQDNYLNQVAHVETEKPPRELLEALRSIETLLGRDRQNEIRYGPRVIDLDILLYGDATIDEPGLTIPHPRILERAFVLVPLAEIAPDVAIGGVSAADALRRIDRAGIRRYDPF